jgi:hypothetical protein
MDRAERLRLYEKLIATNEQVERKGATMPYTSANGNMFSFLPKTGRVALRLPAGERETFLKKYRTKLSVQYGAVMEEYVEVPDNLLAKTAVLAKLFALSVAYAHGLKAKPTARKKTATKKAIARGKGNATENKVAKKKATWKVAKKVAKKKATRAPRKQRSARDTL